jgi:ribosomal protein RSM22 (predicted rRNA methylase)
MTMPSWISRVLEDALEGVSRKELRGRAQAISDAYRSDGTSTVIRGELDALAYATVRMPATYAAIRASLSFAAAIIPDFAPQSLLDIGAGPGTASWAAQDLWPSLGRATLIDRNPHLLEIARRMAAQVSLATDIVLSDVQSALRDVVVADLVVAGYALTELANDVLPVALKELWRLARGMLVIVEPGTPQGFARILACRDQLIAGGGHIVAPCSHVAVCPLRSAARWCHFSERLPRSRAHLFAKEGALSFEDERFSYLAVAKGMPTQKRYRRILATPRVTKGEITLSLCAPEKVEERIIPRRDKAAYKAAKDYGWGDAIILGDPTPRPARVL